MVGVYPMARVPTDLACDLILGYLQVIPGKHTRRTAAYRISCFWCPPRDHRRVIAATPSLAWGWPGNVPCGRPAAMSVKSPLPALPHPLQAGQDHRALATSILRREVATRRLWAPARRAEIPYLRAFAPHAINCPLNSGPYYLKLATISPWSGLYRKVSQSLCRQARHAWCPDLSYQCDRE